MTKFVTTSTQLDLEIEIADLLLAFSTKTGLIIDNIQANCSVSNLGQPPMEKPEYYEVSVVTEQELQEVRDLLAKAVQDKK